MLLSKDLTPKFHASMNGVRNKRGQDLTPIFLWLPPGPYF